MVVTFTCQMAYTSPIQHLIVSLPSPLALAIFASQLAFCHELCDEIETNMLRRHENWIAKHGRVYEDMKEKERRYMIFKNNVKLIEAFNKRTGQMYTLSVNRFADMTNEEFRAIYNGYKKQYYPSKAVSSSLLKASRFNNVSDLPDFVDWREQGCCWAFSAVAATEGITKLKTGNLISLSEQQLVERNTNRDDHGCKGGLMSSAFQFIQDSGGLTTEANYTYKGLYGSCNTQRAASPAAIISGHENVPDNDEQALLQAVSHQPVSVAVDAGSYAFLFYSTEVLAGPCGTNLNHDVAAVGCGTTVDGIKYWLVKNSWGTSWGESGYVRMKRDVSAKEGPCGIAMEASYPTVLNRLKERTTMFNIPA